jgi:hypothetical protein
MLFSLNELRKQPESVRRRYAFLISFGLVLIIGGFWAVSFISTLITPKQEAAVAAAPSPIGVVTEDINQNYQAVKENIANSNPFTKSGVATSTSLDQSNQVIITDTGQ